MSRRALGPNSGPGAGRSACERACRSGRPSRRARGSPPAGGASSGAAAPRRAGTCGPGWSRGRATSRSPRSRRPRSAAPSSGGGQLAPVVNARGRLAPDLGTRGHERVQRGGIEDGVEAAEVHDLVVNSRAHAAAPQHSVRQRHASIPSSRSPSTGSRQLQLPKLTKTSRPLAIDLERRPVLLGEHLLDPPTRGRRRGEQVEEAVLLSPADRVVQAGGCLERHAGIAAAGDDERRPARPTARTRRRSAASRVRRPPPPRRSRPARCRASRRRRRARSRSPRRAAAAPRRRPRGRRTAAGRSAARAPRPRHPAAPSIRARRRGCRGRRSASARSAGSSASFAAGTTNRPISRS